MPQRPSRSAVGLNRNILRCFLLLPILAAAQPLDNPPGNLPGSYQDTQYSENVVSNTVALGSAARAKQDEYVDIDQARRGEKSIDHTTERAIATLAPANDKLAVRAPLAQSAGSSAALSSRPQARSLQDWEVADFVLLATVDGKIHARDRKTGEPKWALEADTPMVEIVYNERNSSLESEEGERLEDDELVWIVEPSQDGNLYVYSGPDLGMQKLGLTIKQLVEDLSPFAGQDPPVVYTGQKKNTLFTVDAATGSILKMFSSSGSSIIDEGSCRRVNGLGGMSGEECESVGTLILGRTEYVVGIQNQETGEMICTIKYFEWGPNNRDRDLQDQHLATMDNKYVYSKYDGSIFALDHTRKGSQRPVYRQKFTSPVVRVFDVARPFDADSRDSSLVILPQPIGPTYSGELNLQHVFVNHTKSGGWYALSENTYPSVTDGARQAACYDDELIDRSDFKTGDIYSRGKSSLIGVHSLSADSHQRYTIQTISDAEKGIDAEAQVHELNGSDQSYLDTFETPQSLFTQVISQTARLALVIILVGVAWKALLSKTPFLPIRSKTKSFNLPKLTTSLTDTELIPPEDVPLPSDNEEPSTLLLQTQKHVERQISQETLRDSLPINSVLAEQESPQAVETSVSQVLNGDPNDQIAIEIPKPKKKAHRGQRGGRKRKKANNNNHNNFRDENKDEEDTVAQIVEDVKQIGNTNGVQPDQITAANSSITDISDIIE